MAKIANNAKDTRLLKCKQGFCWSFHEKINLEEWDANEMNENNQEAKTRISPTKYVDEDRKKWGIGGP